MGSATLLDGLSPDLRIALAVIPFAIAVAMRIMTGRSPVTRWLITVTSIWFAINLLLAPDSAGLREALMDLSARFR